MTRLDSRLQDWAGLSGDSWPTLLTGNGLSINVWEGFSYDRLLDEAVLDPPAARIFRHLRTSNFESVLEALMHAEMVLSALGSKTARVNRVYRSVRDSLFQAVRRVHVPWVLVPTATSNSIASALARHDHIFTTNYDLVPYWALMETPNVHIADFFWSPGGTFDLAATDVFAGYSAMCYLHGGIHLWQSDRTGETGKWTSDGSGLLRLGTLFSLHSDRRPLFVSEGSARAKRRTIRRSDYLSFALERLGDDEADTVIFGSSLSTQDDHIVDALRRGRRRRIAVGLRPAKRETVLGRKGYFVERLSGQRVLFFDATSHPLGDPSLRIPTP